MLTPLISRAHLISVSCYFMSQSQAELSTSYRHSRKEYGVDDSPTTCFKDVNTIQNSLELEMMLLIEKKLMLFVETERSAMPRGLHHKHNSLREIKKLVILLMFMVLEALQFHLLKSTWCWHQVVSLHNVML
ncbi:unnamed protein product [Eruca vesicaria subsp. sativa]|uniref:Uncharacterized protein n=1 Tax=Eruca vesicaria subsp. sativa TaxID=29727 RepID=A0ABC8KQ18_ERUVS|nr:unnamed protein product [Eruca vesicaria subsp. sativa]